METLWRGQSNFFWWGAGPSINWSHRNHNILQICVQMPTVLVKLWRRVSSSWVGSGQVWPHLGSRWCLTLSRVWPSRRSKLPIIITHSPLSTPPLPHTTHSTLPHTIILHPLVSCPLFQHSPRGFTFWNCFLCFNILCFCTHSRTQFKLDSIPCLLTVNSEQWTVNSYQCSAHYCRFSIVSIHCTFWTAQFELHNAHYTFHDEHYTLHIAHLTRCTL